MYRINYQRIYDGKQLVDIDIPRLVVEGLASPFEVLKALNGFFPDCLDKDTRISLLPTAKDLTSTRIETLRGPCGCRCRIYIEYYEG